MRRVIVINTFSRALVLLVIVMAQMAHAQVTVDVTKITCEQFNVLQKQDSVAVWLGGYYHGVSRDPVIELNKFENNVKELRAACRRAENFKQPVMQIIENQGRNRK
jgi:hypothetical protein